MSKRKMGNLNIDFDYSKLEFDKILEDIRNYALSELGRNRLENTIPKKDYKNVKYSLDVLHQFISFLTKEEKLSIDIFYNFNEHLENAQRHIVLTAENLYKLAFSVRLYFFLTKKLNNIKYPLLKNLFSIKNIDDKFHIEILKYIDDSGYIDSGISIELRNIRNKINAIDARIKKETDAFFKKVKGLNYTTDEIITIRDGFNCIAIKSSYKNRVDGIIIDSSSTGQSVFVVPKKAIELHNEFLSLKDDENKEIKRILSQYTERILLNINELKTIDKELIIFDIFYAKAKYSLANEYNIPEIVKDKKIKILSGKHPVIGKKAVPLEVTIGDDYNIIVITGPNTGGKTVVLKTIGLFVLMLQSGIAIPASSTSQFSVFKKVFVDIGDEQSIEQSLSTFSAHLRKIINVVSYTDDESLVLLDEFCAGTDPAEGSALAISILKELIKRKSVVVVTTHYSAIKYFASQEDGIENGSMEFDSEKLIPTYKLNVGIPGSSKALEISQRLGMPDFIINDAKKNISEDFINIEKLMSKLENQKIELEEKEKVIDNERLKIEEKDNKLTEKNEKLNKKEEEIKKKEKLYESDFLKESRKEFEKIVKNIKIKNASKESIKEGKKFLEEVNEVIEKEKENNIKNEKEYNYKIGDSVLIISKDIKGTIIGKGNKENEYLVQAGIIKMNFLSKELKLLGNEKKNDKIISVKSPDIKREVTLDLRGFRFEDAEKRLEKFIDDSILNNITSVRVIHGHGEGIIKKCIDDYCRRSPYIADYDFEKGLNNSTNFGVTIIKLKG